ncbi:MULTISPECIES: ATP-binding cassette domain-containing protein [Pseudomonas]|uniref:ATP-binding cassette domain-containing protein n=1 Tax=Pseudomonas TaxID=286 RepID=UPI001BE5853D|nr:MULTISPECIES: ATP-binding cassette domain-containing protein [Pseudomonas]MBT2340057.1 ATP-binding cassette domain-containing protein [Pseudomonas fluorescens]MCD4527933.1 ATP-binding cassette domain-containing protein [Pseudomonas sp. C3-2018]
MYAIQTMIKSAYQKHTALLVTTLVTILALKLIVLAPPLLLGTIIDTLQGDATVASNTLLMLTAGLIVAGCIHAIISPLQIHVLCKLVQHIVMTASIGWIRRLIRKEFALFDSWRIGHFIKSVERGITAHEQLLTFLVTVALPVCLEFVVVGGAFLYMGGSGVFLSMTGLGVIYLVVTHRIIRWRRKHIDAVNEQEDELSARLYNTLNAGKAIKLECAESTAMLPLNQAFERYATAAVTTASSGGLLSAAKILFVSLSTGGLLWWGVVDQLSGQPSLSVGQLVAIFSIAGTYLLSIATLTEGYRVLDQFLADQRQFQGLLSLADFDHCDRQTDMDFDGDSILELTPCTVTETGEPRLSIKQSLIFSQGQSVAITGPSGAGKSTFLEVLAGLDALTRDHLSIDSISVSLLTRRAHLSALRYCPQQPRFLEGLFERSVLFGGDVSPLLSHAIRQLQLEDVTGRHISENAANISGGEAKRLSLLRLINKPGTFNLFDEPSASIEPRLAAPLWDLLFEVFADRGLICVTHDVDHLHRFDRVIVMDGGVIVDDGPWRELVSRPAIELLLDEIRH